MLCPFCNNEIPDGVKICPFCRKKLTGRSFAKETPKEPLADAEKNNVTKAEEPTIQEPVIEETHEEKQEAAAENTVAERNPEDEGVEPPREPSMSDNQPDSTIKEDGESVTNETPSGADPGNKEEKKAKKKKPKEKKPKKERQPLFGKKKPSATTDEGNKDPEIEKLNQANGEGYFDKAYAPSLPEKEEQLPETTYERVLKIVVILLATVALVFLAMYLLPGT